MVLYTIYKIELLGFLHQGNNTYSEFSGSMIPRNLLRPTRFWEWGNGENYITRVLAIIYYQQVLFLAALQPDPMSPCSEISRSHTTGHTHTHTHTRISVRAPLNEGSASCRGRYIYNTRKRRISLHSVGFEPTIPAVETETQRHQVI